MSTVRANSILDSSGGNTAQINGMTPTAQSLQGFRNRIINGDMRIDQRNNGASVTTTTQQTFYVDRFCGEKVNLSTLVANGQQVADAPAGFRNSLRITVTTAEASGASSSFIGADQRIEGFNFADMAFGTASAQSFTMSFWVKSSVTGTYPVSFFNASVNRAYLATYVVNSANTWEYKTITVPGDTSGSWNTTNGIGLGFQMSLGGGTNNDGTAGSWGSTYKSRTSACVNLNATLNATWQITGVQLEAGSVATPFERRDYGRELIMCQRYFFRYSSTTAFGPYGMGHGINANLVRFSIKTPVTMRAQPTLAFSTASSFLVGWLNALSAISAAEFGQDNFSVDGTSTGLAAWGSYMLTSNNNTTSFITASAEL